MNGVIFNIQRFCVDDGPGIRTTVFLKGCPLHCVWCHNPESQKPHPQLLYSPEKCIGCGACTADCPNGLHRFSEGSHIFDRDKCTNCGACAAHCYAEALEYCGKTASVGEDMQTVLSDKAFYGTDGGLTLSGGEPLMQPDFSLALASEAKAQGIHVCMETSGFCETETLKKIAPFIDTFLFDFKLWDEELHRSYIGVSNRLILQNLKYLSQQGSDIILRCPIIPDVNLCQAHFDAIAQTALENPAIRQIDLLPYHPLGISKYRRLGKPSPYDRSEFLDKSALIPYAEDLKKKTKLPVNL